MTDYATIGRKKLLEIDGEAGVRVEETLNGICPDLARYLIEYSFGEIYSREILDNTTKEQARRRRPHRHGYGRTPAEGSHPRSSPCWLFSRRNPGDHHPDVRVRRVPGDPERDGHAHGGLKRTGQTLSKNQSMPDLGTGTSAGRNWLSQIAPDQEQVLKETFDPINPDITRYVIEFGYGDIYARGILPIRNRQVATIAALAAKGTAPSQLRFHIGGGLRAGLSEAEIVEIMLLVSVYAGFPAALNGILATREVAEALKDEKR